jgi:hypothetical protein
MDKTSQKQGFCVFCGNPGLTKEHVWADWLNPYVAKDLSSHSVSSEILHEDDRIEGQYRVKSGDPRSRRLRIVCQDCNNGWMSRLQETTKMYLAPLVLGEVTAFDVPIQKRLGAWIAMSVMVSERLDVGTSVISASERQCLRTNQMAPSNWKIWIGDYARDDWPGYWVHFAGSVYPAGAHYDRLPDGSAKPNTQTTAFIVGRLYIYAASSTSSVFDGEVRSKKLVSLWPTRRNIIGWPPETMNDNDADRYAGAFQRYRDVVRTSME